MPLSGSWISVTYLFKNKLIALNSLLYSAECTITREKEHFCFHGLKSCLDKNSGGLNVTIASQAVVLSECGVRSS
jgi:hypothetical protein